MENSALMAEIEASKQLVEEKAHAIHVEAVFVFFHKFAQIGFLQIV